VTSVMQQMADLAELKAAMRRREMLHRGTPEWDEAVAVEERVIARIRNWVQPRHRTLLSED